MDCYYSEYRKKQSMKKIKKVFFNKKLIKALGACTLTIVGIGGVSALTASIKDHKDDDSLTSRSVEEILYEVQDDTCVDELFEQKGINPSDIDKLHDYIVVSELMNSLDFKGYDYSKMSDYELKDPKDLRIMVAAYKDSSDTLSEKEKMELKDELMAQECLVNTYISDSYRYMEDVTKYTAKAKMADSFGFDESRVKDITIMPYTDKYFATMEIEENGRKKEVFLNTNDKVLRELVSSLYSMQSKGMHIRSADYNEKNSNPNTYNKFRNQYIDEAVDNVKYVLDTNYKADSYNIENFGRNK